MVRVRVRVRVWGMVRDRVRVTITVIPKYRHYDIVQGFPTQTHLGPHTYSRVIRRAAWSKITGVF